MRNLYAIKMTVKKGRFSGKESFPESMGYSSEVVAVRAITVLAKSHPYSEFTIVPYREQLDHEKGMEDYYSPYVI